VVIASFVTWLVVFFGYRVMHDFNRVTAVVALVLFAVLLVRLLQHASGESIDMTGFHFSTWLLFFSINVSGQVGWAPARPRAPRRAGR
jgi:nucleobase:cation symporter-1, NCS1 family